jgi:O-antigen ligase
MTVFIIILAMLYFPIIPNLSFGSIEASATAFPILLLAGMALLKLRQKTPVPQIDGWQKTLFFFLTLSFVLAIIFTTSMRVTLSLLPNMGLYLLELFSIPILVDSNRKLVTVAKASMVLSFILSFWKVELGSLRDVLGLPGLGGINGIVFEFHPAVAIGLVVLLVQPSWFSRGWQLFSALTLVSLILHGVEFQTRAAWLAWIIMLIFITSCLSWRRLGRLMFLLVPIIALLLFPYLSLFVKNLEQTQQTMTALSNENTSSINKDDLIREVGLRAGMVMFRERPLLGWGPGLYTSLLRQYSFGSERSFALGAFNAWLISLTEIGLFGVLATLALVLTPLWISWRQLRKTQNDYKWLAFAFVLSMLGLAIHLLFISLMYSFFWVHLGLALAGARLAIVEVDEKDLIQFAPQRIMKFAHHRTLLRSQRRL